MNPEQLQSIKDESATELGYTEIHGYSAFYVALSNSNTSRLVKLIDRAIEIAIKQERQRIEKDLDKVERFEPGCPEGEGIMRKIEFGEYIEFSDVLQIIRTSN